MKLSTAAVGIIIITPIAAADDNTAHIVFIQAFIDQIEVDVVAVLGASVSLRNLVV